MTLIVPAATVVSFLRRESGVVLDEHDVPDSVPRLDVRVAARLPDGNLVFLAGRAVENVDALSARALVTVQVPSRSNNGSVSPSSVARATTRPLFPSTPRW